MNISERIERASAQAMRVETELVEQFAAAYMVETGRAPMLIQDVVGGRQWVVGDPDGDVAKFVGLGVDIKTMALRYGLKTDLPPSRAVLVRMIGSSSIGWRFEERAT